MRDLASTLVPLGSRVGISIEAGCGAPQAARIAILGGHDIWQIFPRRRTEPSAPTACGEPILSLPTFLIQ